VTDHCDVLVIGSGPGGATTAARLAETGRRVLMLERGDFLPRERDNWSSRAAFGDAKYTADETDPAASVLDVHCKAHDLDNLYVVDGSFMPSIGAVNPALTIIANALRVGDHIAGRIGTIP